MTIAQANNKAVSEQLGLATYYARQSAHVAADFSYYLGAGFHCSIPSRRRFSATIATARS
jgi:hypothetical protein